jgi:hypothetical protein
MGKSKKGPRSNTTSATSKKRLRESETHYPGKHGDTEFDENDEVMNNIKAKKRSKTTVSDEKRLRKYRSSAPKSYNERLERATSQR